MVCAKFILYLKCKIWMSCMSKNSVPCKFYTFLSNSQGLEQKQVANKNEEQMNENESCI